MSRQLTRHQFEILTYVEKHGTAAYPLRDLSDAVCISAKTVRTCIGQLAEAGFICCDGEILSLTEAGLEALEPYRVTRAVILGAGFGSRLMPATAEMPKPMVKVNGKRIIESLLEALNAAGITDITIVRGYRKEAFDLLKEKYPTLKFVDNDDYSTTNNITSLELVLPLLNGCYICEADLYVRNPDLILKYQYCSNFIGSYCLESDDWCYRIRDGYISNYQKGGTYCYLYYGISYWTAEDCVRLREDVPACIEEGGKDLFWEFVPLVRCHDHYRVEVRHCTKNDIMEIDSYEELAQIDPAYR